MPTEYNKWENNVRRVKNEVDDVVRQWGGVAFRLRACSQSWFNYPCPVSEGVRIIRQAQLLLQKINELRETAPRFTEDKAGHGKYLMGVLDDCEEELRRVINEAYLVWNAQRVGDHAP
jgi:hypothetical protein